MPDMVKVKFRGKLVEQFGKRSFWWVGEPVAANMTSEVFLSQGNKLSLSSRLKYQFSI